LDRAGPDGTDAPCLSRGKQNLTGEVMIFFFFFSIG
jgi:hypothetical protein